MVKICEINVTNIHLKLAEVLLECIKQDGENALITYSEMCDRADNIVEPFFSSRYLCHLSSICHQNNLPLISTIVVSKKNSTPGKGFFTLYTELTGNTVSKFDEKDVFNKELEKARNFTNWHILADILGLDELSGSYKKEPKIEAQEEKLKLEQHVTKEIDSKIAEEEKPSFLKNLWQTILRMFED